jgi:hypothetical protein
MGSTPDFIRKKYGPLQQKSLKTALAQVIAKQFPRIGGPRIQDLCADLILERIDALVRDRQQLTHGQALWLAIDRDDPPKLHKMIRDTRLVPVTLDISTPDDIERRIQRQTPSERFTAKAVRLCQQAYDQGGLLSNCDIAEILSLDDARVAQCLTTYERTHQCVVPRRATLHDVGSGVTHKAIICQKRYRDGKESHVIAQETHHSIEAVDRYLGQYDRVRYCRDNGMSPDKTAFTLNCSQGLVQQYLDILNELESKP